MKELYRAAWKCISVGGVESLTLEAITEESGVTVGALYTYFRSRDEFVAEMKEAALASLLDPIEAAISPPSDAPSQLFCRLIEEIRRASEKEPHAISAAAVIMCSRPPSSAEAGFDERYRDVLDRLQYHASEWQRNGAVPCAVTAGAIVNVVAATAWGHFVQQNLDRTPGRKSFIDAQRLASGLETYIANCSEAAVVLPRASLEAR